jgi:hypothetical protein
MSDINTVFTYFETKNHTGNISTSSYSLPFCFFSFIPKLETTSITPPLTAVIADIDVLNTVFFIDAYEIGTYSFTTNESGTYTVSATPTTSYIQYIELYDSENNLVTTDSSYPNPTIVTSLSAASNYSVYVYNDYESQTFNLKASGPKFINVPIVKEFESTSSISDASRLSNRRIVWDYGDGTSSEAMTGRHSYSQPGRYKVTCYLYDRMGESYYDIFTQNVDVLDYLQNFITLSASSSLGYTLTAGKITDPILVTRSTSWQYYGDDIKKPLSIVSFVSGSRSSDYFNLDKHYSHLPPSHSTYLLISGSSNETEFVEVSSFNIDGTPIYTKLSSGQVVETDKNDSDGVFSGTTGSTLIYTKDDFTSSGINVFFGYEPNTLKPISNTSTVGFKASVVENTDLHKLSITSNGMDGEGFTTSSFNIGKNKFSNSKIGFVIKVKDSQDFTIRDLPLIQNVNIVLTDGLVNYPASFYSNLGSLSGLTTGGFFKGYMIAEIPTLTENLFLSANCVVNSASLTGTSDTFSIYPSGGYYNIAKRGEDIDFKEQFKSIAFQPLFLDKKILFDDFLGSIFGNISSVQSSIGKTTYEKIKNFVDNNTVIDYSNLDQLVATLELLNENNTSLKTPNSITPGEINRLINLLSINHSRLFGTRNQFNQNFKSYGYLDNEYYGNNLGEEVTINHIITAGQDLVAFEKFSGEYKYLNTYLPLCATYITFLTGDWGIESELITETTEDLILTESISSISTDFIKPVINYCLSGYNDTWGWGLVLPNDEYGYGVNLSNYYLFYKHIPTINGTIADGVINFNDVNNTLSYTNSSYQAWSGEDGIISNILTYQIYKGLNLFE